MGGIVLDVDDIGRRAVVGDVCELLLHAALLEERGGLTVRSGERLAIRGRVALGLRLEVGDYEDIWSTAKNIMEGTGAHSE